MQQDAQSHQGCTAVTSAIHAALTAPTALDKLPEVLSAGCTWIYPRENVHLQAHRNVRSEHILTECRVIAVSFCLGTAGLELCTTCLLGQFVFVRRRSVTTYGMTQDPTNVLPSFFCCFVGRRGHWAARVCSSVQVLWPSCALDMGSLAL